MRTIYNESLHPTQETIDRALIARGLPEDTEVILYEATWGDVTRYVVVTDPLPAGARRDEHVQNCCDRIGADSYREVPPAVRAARRVNSKPSVAVTTKPRGRGR